MRKLFFFLMLFGLGNCSSLLDCAGSSAPKWENRDLPDGARYQPYSQAIPLENSSNFGIDTFSLTGNLPNGVDYVFYGDAVQLSGTPTENGTFHFKLKVKGQYHNNSGDDSASCPESAERSYSLKIN